jgi:hypothetical protein
MRNWNTLNVNKKTMIENYKIAIFAKDDNNVQLYTSDFICNNQAQLLLEIIIEMYFEFYINDISIIKNLSNCIEIIKNFNKIFLVQEKFHFNILSNQLQYLEKSNSKYFIKGYEVALSIEKNFLLKNIIDIHREAFITISQYLPKETHNYFLELIFYISSNNLNKTFSLLNTIINKFKKIQLLKNIETINENFKDNIIILLFELFKIYKKFINNPKLDNTFDICYEIFNWKLKKSNIMQRSSLIFLLFEMILTNKGYTIKNKNTNIDINGINSIYKQLLDYYGIDKNKIKMREDKKKEKEMKKQERKNSEDTNNENDNKNVKTEEDIIDEKMSYLYNLFDYDNKKLRSKNNKVERNKSSMIINSSKPIELDCNERIFSASFKNDVNIIKNY